MADVEPGKQYLGVVCEGCKKLAPFLEVDADTKEARLWGEFQIECLHCGHKAMYPASALRMMTVHQTH